MTEPDPSLGIYIHVPFCKHACPYCDFYKIELRERRARERLEFPLLLAREHELLLQADPALADRPLASIYFGGGTPSVLAPKGVAEFIRIVRSRHPGSLPEITLEANPENLTPARCAAWKECGINRLSIGVQSFLERDLVRLERLHRPESIFRSVSNARVSGFDNISIDLMFALPEQRLCEWEEALEKAIALDVQHLSLYSLTLHEGTPFHIQNAIQPLPLPAEEEGRSMYLLASERLTGAGYEHYEISNFARPGFRSVHNSRYWTARDVVGIGPGAHSSLGAARWYNPDDIDRWRACLSADRLAREEIESLGGSALLEEEVFRRLRRREGFRTGAPPGTADRLFLEWVDSEAGRTASAEGYVERGPDHARITPTGWVVSDSILASILSLSRRRSVRGPVCAPRD